MLPPIASAQPNPSHTVSTSGCLPRRTRSSSSGDILDQLTSGNEVSCSAPLPPLAAGGVVPAPPARPNALTGLNAPGPRRRTLLEAMPAAQVPASYVVFADIRAYLQVASTLHVLLACPSATRV